MFSSNSTITIEKSSCDVEVTSTTLLTVFNLSSNGSVINFSISSAVFPGNTELIYILVSFTSGKFSLAMLK